jgi:hypothetical protein
MGYRRRVPDMTGLIKAEVVKVEPQLEGEARVLELADAMRRAGGCAPHRLHHECVEAFHRGEVEFDAVTTLYRHAMIHAGAIVPRDRPRFHVCPECEAELNGQS